MLLLEDKTTRRTILHSKQKIWLYSYVMVNTIVPLAATGETKCQSVCDFLPVRFQVQAEGGVLAVSYIPPFSPLSKLAQNSDNCSVLL